MSSKRRKTAFVVSHTHWDREWYCTFEEYRFRLVEGVRLLLDVLKKDPEYRSFHFDGQVAPVLDYLEIRPGDREELTGRIREGRIVVGPWFVLADELIPGGESMVANLRLGLEESGRLGCDGPFVAYVPDQFGHPAQTPQVLRQFGLDAAYMSRGLSREEWWGREFEWKAPDGSGVFVYFNCYCNGQALHRREIEGMSEDGGLADNLLECASRAVSGTVIMMDGCDHFPPNLGLREAMKALSDATGFSLRHTTLFEAVRAIRRAVRGKRLPVFEGELRYDLEEGQGNLINLNGTLSSRIYLKQYNRKVETLLERWAEPFSAFSFLLGGTHHAGELRLARKFLLLNLPHDSICGCSVDRVHRQMISRYESAEELGETVLRRSVTDASALNAGEKPPYPPEYPPFTYPSPNEDVEELAVVVANAVPSGLSEVVMVRFDLPPRWNGKRISAEDVAGSPVHLQVLGDALVSEWEMDRALRRQEAPWKRPVCAALLPTEPVPACGMLALRLRKGKGTAAGDLSFGKNWAANSFLRVSVNRNGSVDLEDASGAVFRGLNLFEDGGDAGGGYHYQKPAKDKVMTSERVRAEVSLVEAGPLMAVLKAVVTLKVPSGLSKDFSRRAGPAVPLTMTSYYVLKAGCPFLEVKTVVENRAAGHRLRAVFPTGIKAREAVVDSQFCFLRRPVSGGKYREHPQQRFVFLEGRGKGKAGFVLMNRGLPEYEAIADGTLYLTLMRSFSWMTHLWWPKLAVPDAEMKGRWEFEYAVAPASDAWDAASKAERYSLPQRAFVLPQEAPEPMLRGSLLELEGKALLSTVERSPFDAGAVEARVYNPLSERSDISLKFGVPLEKAWKVRLDGKRLRKLPVKERRRVSLSLGPFEIATVRVFPLEPVQAEA